MGKTGKNAAQKVITGAVAEADKRFKRRGKRLFAAKRGNEFLHGRAHLPRCRIAQKRGRYGVSGCKRGQHLRTQTRQLRGEGTFRQMQGNQQAAEKIVAAWRESHAQAEQSGWRQSAFAAFKRLQKRGNALLQTALHGGMKGIRRRHSSIRKRLPCEMQSALPHA